MERHYQYPTAIAVGILQDEARAYARAIDRWSIARGCLVTLFRYETRSGISNLYLWLGP